MAMAATLAQPVDVVCERTGPGWGAEPLNTLTSMAYLLLGLGLLWSWRQTLSAQPLIALLVGLLILLGLASMAAHTIATQLTHLLNGAFTGAFMAVAIWGLARQIWGLTATRATGFTGALLLLSLAAGSAAGMLQQQQQFAYLPALLFLGATAWRAGPKTLDRMSLSLATMALALGLTLHALDLPFCAITQGYGTHAAWHLLNDLVLFGVMLTLHRATMPKASSST